MPDTTFDGPAGQEYDLIGLVNPHYEQIRALVVDALYKATNSFDPNVYGKVIDILEPGCGTGLTTIRLLGLDNRIRVHAVDHSATMIEKARKYLPPPPPHFWNESFNYMDWMDRMAGRVQRSAAKLIKSDIESELHICDSPNLFFHTVVSTFMLHDLTEKKRNKVIFELHRVLRPGGIFINADKIAVDDPVEHQQQLEARIAKFDIFDRL